MTIGIKVYCHCVFSVFSYGLSQNSDNAVYKPFELKNTRINGAADIWALKFGRESVRCNKFKRFIVLSLYRNLYKLIDLKNIH